jgi:hypothetical protein
MECLIEAHFLPSLEYFCALQRFDKIILEKHEHFNKQSYRNRCYILTSQGRERLTIPVTATHAKIIITDVQIDYTTRWQNNMLRTLESAYAKAPYYEHYMDDLKKEILSGHKYLYDLNLTLLSMCLQWLNWDRDVSESVSYKKNTPVEINDLRDQILAKKDFGARGFYRPVAYQQVFGNNFVPNLSLVDLVFCAGPDAQALIRGSQNKI